ncbi:hypothetical protein U9M48_017759 [Paspalum notatum var. saurae]|uniref:Uncharacterized protein n=1 Tax=Paspalum notatum var. saurae TaxID=547442 RepID=A0AAQ3WP47_PASNO
MDKGQKKHPRSHPKTEPLPPAPRHRTVERSCRRPDFGQNRPPARSSGTCPPPGAIGAPDWCRPDWPPGAPRGGESLAASPAASGPAAADAGATRRRNPCSAPRHATGVPNQRRPTDHTLAQPTEEIVCY